MIVTQKTRLVKCILLCFLLAPGVFAQSQPVADVVEKQGADISADHDAALFDAINRFLSGDPQSAQAILENIKIKDPLVLTWTGLVQEDAGDAAGAAVSYAQAIKRGCGLSLPYYRLAKIRYQQGLLDEAAAWFKQAIVIDPSLRPAYYYLADCLQRSHDPQKAYLWALKAAAFYPAVPGPLRLFAAVKKDLGPDYFRSSRALKDTQRAQAQFKEYVPVAGSGAVSVGLAKGIERFTFRCGGWFKVTSAPGKRFDGGKDRTYRVALKKGVFLIINVDQGKVMSAMPGPLNIVSGGSPFYIFDLDYGQGGFWHKKIDRSFRGALKVFEHGGKITLVNELSLEDYLYGVLPAEISTDSGDAALKAQAVAARTIAVRYRGRHKKEGFDFCADVHCQVYQGMSVEQPQASKAVDETRGQVLVFADKPIEAFYHADCGGALRSDAFGPAGYLKTQVDADSGDLPTSAYRIFRWFLRDEPAFCRGTGSSKFRWQRVYDPEDFLLSFGYPISDLQDIDTGFRGEGLRYNQVKITTVAGTKELSGDLSIRTYFDQLKSSAFLVQIKRSADGKPGMLLFWGAGFGHGSGLCQDGAAGMSGAGFDYQAILAHYYPGAELKKKY